MDVLSLGHCFLMKYLKSKTWLYFIGTAKYGCDFLASDKREHNWMIHNYTGIIFFAPSRVKLSLHLWVTRYKKFVINLKLGTCDNIKEETQL
jgi:hypothetical protein